MQGFKSIIHSKTHIMKKYLFIRTAVLTASVFSFAAIYCQSASSDKFASLNYTRPQESSGTVAISENADKTALMAIKARNTKMFNHFSKDFKNASGIKVSTEKGETHVSCTVNGVTNKIDYNKKGRWLYTIRYYDVDKLPQDIGNQVNSGYPGFSIFGCVAEVSVPDKIAYFVMIENKTSWKRIRIVNGEMDAYEEYLKP